MMKPSAHYAGMAIVCLLASAMMLSAQAGENPELTCLSALWENTDIAEASMCLKDLIKKSDGDGESTELTASYALGVQFQREVAREFTQLSYLQFLMGSLDEVSSKTRFSDKQLTKTLKEVLLSPEERSAKLVREFSMRTGVSDLKGIYYIEHTLPKTATGQTTGNEQSGNSLKTAVSEENEDSTQSNTSQLGTCAKSTNKRTYVVDYQRLMPGDEMPDVNKLNNKCLALDEQEVIRGWRTALKKMEVDDVWEILVPAALAYGEKGINSNKEDEHVDPGEALHFMIRLRAKS